MICKWNGENTTNKKIKQKQKKNVMKNTKRNSFTIITVTIRIQRMDKLKMGRDKNINIIRNLLIQWKAGKK